MDFYLSLPKDCTRMTQICLRKNADFNGFFYGYVRKKNPLKSATSRSESMSFACHLPQYKKSVPKIRNAFSVMFFCFLFEKEADLFID